MASSEEKEENEVTEEYLQHLADNLTSEWPRVARHLGVSDVTIYNNKVNNPGHVEETKYETLLSWKRNKGKDATYEVLAEALSKAGRKDLSDKFQKGKVKKRLRENESASDKATTSRSKQRKTECSTAEEEPSKAGLKNIPSPDPLTSTSFPTPASVPHGYMQFRIKLESLLTGEHARKLSTSLGYAADKIEDISKSDTPSRLLVRSMDESGEISPTDIPKLITALEKETGLEDVAVKVKETFELYGEFYEKFLRTLELKLTLQDAVSLAEYFAYPDETISNIRESETPSKLLVQLMCERYDISPTENSKLKRALRQESFELATEVDEAFELQRKTTQFVKELRGKYKNLCRGILPVPFLREKYDIDKVFVENGIELVLDERGNEEKEKRKKLENHKVIFTARQLKSKRRIIDGEPGYGKSTLALQMTHEWCQRKEPMKGFPILILLRLSQFGNETNVCAAIKKFLLPKDSKLDGDDIKNILDSSAALYILDGYDEYPGRENKESEIACIIKGDMFQNQEVVLLTRTSCPPHDTTSDTKRINLTGFNKDVRFEYIRKIVTVDNSVKAKEIKQLIENSPVAADFCRVPMFCVMICHMAKENKTFKDLDTVTKLFKRVIACFHSHEKMRKDRKAKLDHSNLDRIAFEALRGTSQKITWDKNELRRDIGENLYDEYTRIGILREEEVFDDDQLDYKTETKFFHKMFAEWYAAHYFANEISQSQSRIGSEHRQNNKKAEGTSQHQHANRETEDLLNNPDPWEFHYMYRFACGLSSDAALEIIKYLGTSFDLEKYTILCIAEWMEQWSGTFDTIEDTVTALCSQRLEISKQDSLLAQKYTVELIKHASKRNIPIHYLRIWFIPDKDDAGNLILKPSNLSLPVMDTVRHIKVCPLDHVVSEEQIENILQYLGKCRGSIKLEFFECVLPRCITVTESMSALTSRDVEITWHLFRYNKTFRLNFTSGQWENLKETMLSLDQLDTFACLMLEELREEREESEEESSTSSE